MVKTEPVSPTVIHSYWRLFVNRQAYTVQSVHPHPQTERHYYFRPKKGWRGAPPRLTRRTIRRHLEGKITIGLYAINPETQRSKWLVLDADYGDATTDLLKFEYELNRDGIQPALEMSRRGGHLWIFFAAPLLAKESRIYIHDVAMRLGVPIKASGQTDGVEVFPKHDAIEAGRFGSAVRGPLGVHRGADRRFWFYGADHTVESQMAYLSGLRKLTEQTLKTLIAGRECLKAQSRLEPRMPSGFWRKPTRSEFRILDHVGAVRVVGRNYVTRCPSCAEARHDRSGDNLAILITDPRFYKCWAGCPKEAIRAALGCPIEAGAVRVAREG
jgi:hypothetical protein